MLKVAEVAGERHALETSGSALTGAGNGEQAREQVSSQALRFLVAADWIALQPLSREVPGVTPDPLQDILVLTARKYRDHRLAQAQQ